VDPQITTLEVLYSLLAKAFDVKSDFSIKYKAFDPAGNEIYLAVRSDWDLDAAFLRIHNISIQTASEPCLILQIDVKPFTVVRECERDMASPGKPSSGLGAPGPTSAAPTAPARELMSPLQSLGVSEVRTAHANQTGQLHLEPDGKDLLHRAESVQPVRGAHGQSTATTPYV